MLTNIHRYIGRQLLRIRLPAKAVTVTTDLDEVIDQSKWSNEYCDVRQSIAADDDDAQQ